MAQKVQIDFILEAVDKISKDVQRMNKSMNNLDKTAKKAKKGVTDFNSKLSKLGNITTGIYSAFKLARGALTTLNRTIGDSVRLAAEQQRVENLLADALQQKGIYTEELFERTKEYASALQQQTTFGDEQILQAQKLLVQLGVEASQLNQVTKATLDLAAAKGIDLNSAADLVSKSIGSTTNALSRYGIQIGKVTSKTERAEAITREISRLFGGAAQAEANTFAGAMKQLSNTIGDTQESLGAVVVENTAVVGSIKILNRFFKSLQDRIKANQETMSNFVKGGLVLIIKSMNILVRLVQVAVNGFLGIKVALQAIVRAGFTAFARSAAKRFSHPVVSG